MTLCLAHPVHGYYMSRDPFGPAGDFITAPEISQMFGELIGIWCVAAYTALGTPRQFMLIELGPGRGTLMSDIMRACRVMPGFHEAARLHLVETSPLLRDLQAARLGDVVTWHEHIGTVPKGPSIVIANEFFDALPIRQYEFRGGQWLERRVGLGAGDQMVIGLARVPVDLAPAPEGTILETAPLREDFAKSLGLRLAKAPGATLIIDYGHSASGTGDTLQAMRRHKYCSILDRPGEADLTAHVDFETLMHSLTEEGAVTHGPMTQRRFLLAMGLEVRAANLAQSAREPERKAITRAVERLAGEKQMGDLFKVLAALSPGLATPYPFGPQ
jgi:SAM-dependent MidA family methyltransferase